MVAVVAPGRGRRPLVGVVPRRSQHDLPPERERLKDDVEAFPVGVRERCADRKPEIILAFSLGDGVRLKSRLLGVFGHCQYSVF
jgi:hypothetical protein